MYSGSKTIDVTGILSIYSGSAQFTLIDEPAQLFDEIGISGGRRGISLRLDPEQLASFIGATFADIVR